MLKLLALLLLTLSGCLVQAGGSVCYRGSYAYECQTYIAPAPGRPYYEQAQCGFDSLDRPVPMSSPALHYYCGCDSSGYHNCRYVY